RASAEGLGDQRLPDAAIRPGDQYRLAFDLHVCCSSGAGSAPPLWRLTYTDQPDSRDSPRPAPRFSGLASWTYGRGPRCYYDLIVVVPTLRTGPAGWTLVIEEPGQVAGRERDGHARRWHGAARPIAPARE